MSGGDGDDALHGGAGDDFLDGGAGHDTLHGGAGHDILRGGAGDDELHGGAGDDVLDGGEGNDILRGGAGADRYVFGANSGSDKIFGFSVREDVIDLLGTAVAGMAFRDLNLRADGSDTVLDLGGGNLVRLVGVRIHKLDESNFILS